MSLYYDLYQSGNPRQFKRRTAALRLGHSVGNPTAKQFIGLISKANGFSNAILEKFFLGISKQKEDMPISSTSPFI